MPNPLIAHSGPLTGKTYVTHLTHLANLTNLTHLTHLTRSTHLTHVTRSTHLTHLSVKWAKLIWRSSGSSWSSGFDGHVGQVGQACLSAKALLGSHRCSKHEKGLLHLRTLCEAVFIIQVFPLCRTRQAGQVGPMGQVGVAAKVCCT